MSISLMLFLYHLITVRIFDEHQNQDMALASLGNSETLHDLEETFGLKLIPLAEYDNMSAEIKNSEKEMFRLNEELKLHNDELSKKLVELLPYLVKYEKLIRNPLVELQRFCDNCKWKGEATTCSLRLAYLVNNHNANPLRAKMKIMDSKPSCKN